MDWLIQYHDNVTEWDHSDGDLVSQGGGEKYYKVSMSARCYKLVHIQILDTHPDITLENARM